jgi:hypothetical protein
MHVKSLGTLKFSQETHVRLPFNHDYSTKQTVYKYYEG